MKMPHSATVALVIGLLSSADIASAQIFTPVTGDPVVEDTEESMGASWVDVDGDGDFDLVVSNGNLSAQVNALYLNDGSGNFERASGGAFTSDVALSNGSSWADFDRDGDMDVFVVNRIQNGAGGVDLFYRNDGGGLFTRLDATELSTLASDGNSSSWVDIDLDGDLDLVVTNFNARNFEFRNNGDGSFTRKPAGILSEDIRFSATGLWGDLDLDGDMDYWTSNAGNQTNSLYLNDGTGEFVLVTTGDVVTTNGSSLGGSFGDIDNDGDLDLFVANFGGQNNELYLNNGNASFTLVSDSEVVSDGGNSVGSAFADIDNDADLDLLVSNDGQANFLYLNDGTGSFSRVEDDFFTVDERNTFSLLVSDFDNDGDQDVFGANRFSQKNLFLTNNGNGNRWLQVALRPFDSNPQAIGARIRIMTSEDALPLWQTRQISTQSGYNAQGTLRAEFGLGTATNVDSVVVYWPSGAVDVLSNVTVDQILVVSEGSFPRSVSVESDELPRNFGVLLNSIAPNPSRSRSTLSYQLEQNALVTIELFDILGRRVSLVSSPRLESAGPHRVALLTDRLTSGVYAIRLRAVPVSGPFRNRLQVVSMLVTVLGE